MENSKNNTIDLNSMELNSVIIHTDETNISDESSVKQIVLIRRVVGGWIYTITTYFKNKHIPKSISDRTVNTVFVPEIATTGNVLKPTPFFKTLPGQEAIPLNSNFNPKPKPISISEHNSINQKSFKEFKPHESKETEVPNLIRYKVDMKSRTGSYKSDIYSFNDDKHFDNWINKMEQDYGYKVLGWELV